MQQVEAVSTDIVDVNPTMNWGAVIAGWAVAVAVAAVLYLGGLALGFSTFDANDAAATAKGIGLGTVGWLVLTWAASLFVGGMFASWFDGREDETMGSMHGVTVWGVSVLASAMVAACGLGHAVGAGATAAVGGASMLPQAFASAGAHDQSDEIMGTASQVLRAQLNKAIRSPSTDGSSQPPTDGATAPAAASGASDVAQPVPGPGNDSTSGPQGGPSAMDRGAMGPVAAALIKGDNDTAKALLAADTSLSQSQIDSLVQTESAKADEFKAKAKVAADQVAKYSAMALGVTVLSILIGLLGAALGGWLGSSHIHRVYHLRRYRRSLARS